MPDYSLGKIYKIYSNNSNLTYYGSTCQKYLSRRIANHTSNYRKYKNGIDISYCSAFKVLECDDWKYELIDKYPCSNSEELKKKEGNYITNNDCVNKNISGRSHNDSQKNYYKNNKHIYLDKVTCECGCEISRVNLTTHCKKQKHIKLLNKLT